MNVIRRKKDNRESGPQTLGERFWAHELVAVSVSVDRSGKEHRHPVVRPHYGPPAGCPKCRAEYEATKKERKPGESWLEAIQVSKASLSPFGKLLFVLVVVIVAAIVTAAKLSAQAPATQLPMGTEPLGFAESVMVILGGIAVVWMCFVFLRLLTKGERPRASNDHSAPGNGLGINGPEFLDARTTHGPHLNKETLNVSGEHPTDPLTQARGERSH